MPHREAILHAFKNRSLLQVVITIFNVVILIHLLHFFKFVQDRTVIGGVNLTQVCLSDMYTNRSFQTYDNYVYFVLFVFLPYGVAAVLMARVCVGYVRAIREDGEVIPPAFRVFKDVSSRTNGAVAALFFVFHFVNIVAYGESMSSMHYLVTSRECRLIPGDRRFVFSPRQYELMNSVALTLNSSTKFFLLLASRRQFRYVLVAFLQRMFSRNVVVDAVRGVFTIRPAVRRGPHVAPVYRCDETQAAKSNALEMPIFKVG